MQLLVITHDAFTEQVFRRVAGELGATAEFRSDTNSGAVVLEQQRFDL
jgi:hypothetical protein